ncbi:hypothetical protein GCK32_009459 [Trichostrongylus colubriformis]|uniref:Uncharacterized protein n=1 Tax=Trichostrongylus colubriformis TaxID=6319 RepID=A0AAN8FYJ6_TRICO
MLMACGPKALDHEMDLPHRRNNTRPVARIVARTWIEMKTVWKEGSVAFARRVWLNTDRKRGARIRTSSEAEKLFGKGATTYYTY